MKYGLGQIDLNLLAQLALLGHSNTPERDIADLMRSGQPIEESTRLLLAEVLDGRGNGIQFKVRPNPRTAPVRAFELRRKRLRMGQEAIELGRQRTKAEANRQIAIKYGCSEKSVEASSTFARRAAAWIESIRPDHAQGFTNSTLEVVFCYADATNKHPDEALKASAGDFAKLIRSFDDLQAPALRGRRRSKST